jgi:hypothetical protein
MTGDDGAELALPAPSGRELLARLDAQDLAVIRARRAKRLAAWAEAAARLGVPADQIGPCAGCHNTLIIRYGPQTTGTLCPPCRAAHERRRHGHGRHLTVVPATSTPHRPADGQPVTPDTPPARSSR